MVKLDVVTLLVRALYANCKVSFPSSLRGMGNETFATVDKAEAWELTLLVPHHAKKPKLLGNIKNWFGFTVDVSHKESEVSLLQQPPLHGCISSHLCGRKGAHQSPLTVLINIRRQFFFINRLIRTDVFGNWCNHNKGAAPVAYILRNKPRCGRETTMVLSHWVGRKAVCTCSAFL